MWLVFLELEADFIFLPAEDGAAEVGELLVRESLLHRRRLYAESGAM